MARRCGDTPSPTQEEKLLSDTNSSSKRKRRKRRANGTGTLNPVSTGGWCLAMTVPVTSYGITRKITRWAQTKEEAERIGEQIRQEIEDHPRGVYVIRNGDKTIYFIQALKRGPIKIGIAKNVEQRFKAIQACSPVPLRVIFTIEEASQEMEQDLHQRFAEDRLHGEWFKPGPILRYIKGYGQEQDVRKKASVVIQEMDEEEFASFCRP